MKKLIIMSGVQGSGKTTYRKKHFKGYSVVSFDEYITEKFSGNYNECYAQYAKLPKLDKEIIKMRIHLEFLHLLKAEKNIVVDFTNATNEQRVEWTKLVDKNIYEVQLLVRDEELETLLERNKSRTGKVIPEPVIKATFERIEDSNLYIEEVLDNFDFVAIF
jgi:predicted kinase